MDISYYKKYEPIFGSWHIVREISEGSFGKVFEIEREDFGKTYKAALKAITIPQNQSEIKSAMADGMDNESVTSYFQGVVADLVEEFAIMSDLKGHSNIVSYEDHLVVKHDENIGWDILIRMELLTPLIDYIQNKTLSRDEAIKLGIDMCKALEACRENNIIHRDIKPENIFISKLGDFKLGDFGIAKTVEKTTGGLSKKGTYTYMAPEVYKGESYGPSVDIYSLGIVLYRFFNNNRTPFMPMSTAPTFREREAAMARRIRGDEIPAPVNADEALAKIVLKACAYNPKDRYASPTEMRLALESLCEKPDVSAPAVEKKTADISEAKTVSEAETDRTVSLFGAVGNKIVEDVPKAGEKEIAEDVSEAETVVEAEEDLDKTVSAFAAVEAKTPVNPIKENIVKKEPAKAEVKESKKPEPKKKKTPMIIAAIAAALAIFAISFFTNKTGWTISENKVRIEERYTYPIVFYDTIIGCNEIKLSYRIKESENSSIYGLQNVYVQSPSGDWRQVGSFIASNGNRIDVDINFVWKDITGIAIVPDHGFGHYTYNVSRVKCIQHTYGN